LGLAVGRIGMSVMDFDRCTPREFNEIVEAWTTGKKNEERAEWEQTRMQCFYYVRMHTTDKLDPKDIIRFEWDNKDDGKTETCKMDPEKERQRYGEIKKKRGIE